MKIIDEELVYTVRNNMGQYLVKCNKKVVDVVYSLAKARVFIEDRLDRLIPELTTNKKYSK